MPLMSIGFTHRTSDIVVRERLTPDGEEVDRWSEVVSGIAPHFVILRTCGRFETFLESEATGRSWTTTEATFAPLFNWLARHAGMAVHQVAIHAHCLTGHRAAWHVYRVAAGLDSALPGEDHILGQVRRAFETAEARNTAGPVLSAVFRGAIHAGRVVRTRTPIQKVAASFSIVAVEQLSRARAKGAKRLLIVGSGTLAGEIAAGATGMNWTDVVVAGRHIDRARTVADLAAGRAVAFEHLPVELGTADVIVACTSSTTFTIRAGMLDCGQAREHSRRRLILDLGLPRNVDPDVALVPGVELLDLDRLAAGRRAKQGLAEAVSQAEHVLAGEFRRLRRWMAARQKYATPFRFPTSAVREVMA